MSEVDALFRTLVSAPPRTAAIVRRVALEQAPLPRVAELFGVDEARARVLVFRATIEVMTGRPCVVPDAQEAAEVDALWGGPPAREGTQAKAFLERLGRNAAELTARLQQAQADFEASPDRKRDELVRYALIALVLALTAFFYWQETHKPLPPPQKRPLSTPPGPPPP
jgi:hypothetical protein